MNIKNLFDKIMGEEEYEGFEDCREACARSFENVAAMLEKCGVGGI